MVKDRLPELLKIQAKLNLCFSEGEKQEISERKSTDLTKMLTQIGIMHEDMKQLKAVTKNAIELQYSVEVTSSPMEQRHLRRKLRKLSENIKTLTKHIRVELRSHQPDATTFSPQTAEMRIKELHYKILVREFLDTVNDYNLESEKHKQKYRDGIKRRMSLAGEHGISEARIQELMDKDNYIFDLKYDIDIAKNDLQQVQERHNDFKNLESSIEELHGLFIDFQKIIHKQQEVVDSIEHNVTNSCISVHNGTLKYRKAIRYKNKKPRIY